MVVVCSVLLLLTQQSQRMPVAIFGWLLKPAKGTFVKTWPAFSSLEQTNAKVSKDLMRNASPKNIINLFSFSPLLNRSCKKLSHSRNQNYKGLFYLVNTSNCCWVDYNWYLIERLKLQHLACHSYDFYNFVKKSIGWAKLNSQEYF